MFIFSNLIILSSNYQFYFWIFLFENTLCVYLPQFFRPIFIFSYLHSYLMTFPSTFARKLKSWIFFVSIFVIDSMINSSNPFIFIFVKGSASLILFSSFLQYKCTDIQNFQAWPLSFLKVFNCVYFVYPFLYALAYLRGSLPT